MKLEIRQILEPISVWGRLEPTDLGVSDREVYLDGKRVHPTLEQIILSGIDTMTHEYVEELLKLKENEG